MTYQHKTGGVLRNMPHPEYNKHKNYGHAR